MKTAMQELKDKFMEAGCLADWMDDAFDEAIEKEKKMVIDAHKARNFLGGGEKFLQEEAEKYYNDTFNNQ